MMAAIIRSEHRYKYRRITIKPRQECTKPGCLAVQAAILCNVEPNVSSIYIAGFFPHIKNVWNRDSITSITTVLQVGRSLVRLPVEARNLSLLQNVLTDSGAHPPQWVPEKLSPVGGGGCKAAGA